MRKIFVILFLLVPIPCLARTDCHQDTLLKNSQGKILQTMSGQVYETLPGDQIDAMLWLPISSLLICSRSVSLQGKSYPYYQITNLDDKEKVGARLISGGGGSGSSNCFESNISKPAPFMGNNGEIFFLSDGSIWEVKYEYEYMYEYYPNVTMCPDEGFVIVNGKKLQVQRVR